MCVCVYRCAYAKKPTSMHVCVLNIRHFSISSVPLLLALAVETTSLLWDMLHPYLPYSSLSRGHICSDCSLPCVYVCPIQRRWPLPLQQWARICRRDAGFKGGTGKLPTSLAKWKVLWKSSVSKAPLCSPWSPTAAASHDYSLARTRSA